jgi:hypothetical protein
MIANEAAAALKTPQCDMPRGEEPLIRRRASAE